MEDKKQVNYRIPVYKVALVKESNYAVDRKRITQPEDAYQMLINYFDGIDREQFVVMMTDTKNKVIGINTVSIGCLDRTIIHPREVFKPAILCNAAAIIIAHNHPSGNAEPSKDDIKTTEQLVNAGKLLGITVLDHMTIGEGEFTSLKQAGHIE